MYYDHLEYAAHAVLGPTSFIYETTGAGATSSFWSELQYNLERTQHMLYYKSHSVSSNYTLSVFYSSFSFACKLTVHIVLLTIPPQTHCNKRQQDEHHHSQNTAHYQVQQSSRRAGGLLGVGARWGDGVLAGWPWGLTCCSREGGRETRNRFFNPPATKKNNTVLDYKMQAIVVGLIKRVIVVITPVI